MVKPLPPPPQTFTDEAAQAFVEDLAAVFAKHSLKVSSSYDYPMAVAMEGFDRFVAIDKNDDIQILEEAPEPPKLRPLEWYEDPSVPRQPPEPEFRAIAAIPTTAHGRLAAAARIATIRTEQEI